MQKQYIAIKRIDGHITVESYVNSNQLRKAYDDTEVAKIIKPYYADNLKHAAEKAGNKLEGGRYIMMEKLTNGLEIPRKYF
jgi:hypothetical protein